MISTKALGIGAAAVALIVCAVLFLQRGAHLELKGAVLKVRQEALDDESVVTVIDFRVSNPSDYPFVVRQVRAFVETSEGSSVEGQVASEADSKRLLAAYPIFGQQFNDVLTYKARVNPHETVDRMTAVRFPLPLDGFEKRKRIRVEIEDVDRTVSEITEKGSKK